MYIIAELRRTATTALLLILNIGYATPQCLHQNEMDFTSCIDRNAEVLRYDSRNLNRVVTSAQAKHHLRTISDRCDYVDVCQRLYTVLRTGQNFGLKVEVELSEMLRKCCGNCTKYHKVVLPKDTPFHTLKRTALKRCDLSYVFPLIFLIWCVSQGSSSVF